MHRLSLVGSLAAFLLLFPATVDAQVREETLADIRQQLVALYVQMERLRRELFPTGRSANARATAGSTNTLQRIDDLESELRGTISKVEQLEFQIAKIAEDGSRRIRDLEYKLVELEGGDLSTLDGGTTLGGEVDAAGVSPIQIESRQTESNVVPSDRQFFERALSAYENGEYVSAVERFTIFLDAYPSGPFTAEAHFYLGEALAGQRDWIQAAKSYLDSFNSDKDGSVAPNSLLRLGASLGKLGKLEEACLVLDSVGKRFPASEQGTEALAEMTRLECS